MRFCIDKNIPRADHDDDRRRREKRIPRPIIFLLFYWAFNQTLSRPRTVQPSSERKRNQKSFTDNKNIEESPNSSGEETSESPRVDDLNISSILRLIVNVSASLRYLFLVSLFNSFVSPRITK